MWHHWNKQTSNQTTKQVTNVKPVSRQRHAKQQNSNRKHSFTQQLFMRLNFADKHKTQLKDWMKVYERIRVVLKPVANWYFFGPENVFINIGRFRAPKVRNMDPLDRHFIIEIAGT